MVIKPDFKSKLNLSFDFAALAELIMGGTFRRELVVFGGVLDDQDESPQSRAEPGSRIARYQTLDAIIERR